MENITERNTNTGIQEAMAEEHPFTDKEWNEAIGKSNNSSSTQKTVPEITEGHLMMDIFQAHTMRRAMKSQLKDVVNEDEEELIVFHDDEKYAECKKLGLKFEVEKTISAYDKNTVMRLKVTDLDSDTVVSGDLNQYKDMAGRLVSCGKTELTNDIAQKMFLEVCKTVICYARGNGNTFVNYSHEVLGWSDLGTVARYCGNAIVDGKSLAIQKSKYRGHDIIMKQSGSLKGWVDAFDKYIANKPVLSSVVASSVSGIIRQRYESLMDETNITICLVGDTSIGKTTAIKIATTMHTTGREILDSNATIGALSKRFASRPSIPATVDEVKLLAGARYSNPIDTLNLLMTLASGSSKDRLSQDGLMRDREQYYAPVFTTSTSSLLYSSGCDEGQAQRIIQFDVETGDLTDNNIESREAERTFEKNRGWVAEAFAMELLKKEKEFGSKEDYEESLFEEYESIRESIAEKLIMPRMANRAAMIILSAKLLKDLLGIRFDLTAMENLLIKTSNDIRKEFLDKPKLINAQKAEKLLVEYFNKYQEFFNEGTLESEDDLKKYLGTFKRKGQNILLHVPSKEILTEMLYGIPAAQILGIEECDEYVLTGDIEHVLDYLKSKQLLKSASDRPYTKKATVVKDRTQYVYEILLRMDK